MGELTELSACAGLLPLVCGNVTVEETPCGALTSLSPFGDASALSGALQQAHGLRWPAPGQVVAAGDLRCIWFGRNEAMLMGARPDTALSAQGAVVDQSDAWAVVTMRGADSVAVLARLVPVDLRPQVFGIGQTLRTSLGHMHVSITRLDADRMMIMVFRSMAGTLVHELKVAMAAVAARG